MRNYLYAAIYVGALCVANLLIYWIGPWWSVVNSFLLIGLDFVLRDHLHERLGIYRVTGLAVLAGLISYAMNPAGGSIAIASSVSFILAALADGATYQTLIGKRWVVKSNASNAMGAAADSLIFPAIAFGALLPQIVLGQFVAKVAGGAVWSVLLRRMPA